MLFQKQKSETIQKTKTLTVLLLALLLAWAAPLASKNVADDETAIKKLAAKLNKKPGDSEALAKMGWYMQKRGFVEKAKEYYLRCLRKDPKNATALINLGNIYKDIDPEASIAYYRKALAS